jgi:hypothetical protein
LQRRDLGGHLVDVGEPQLSGERARDVLGVDAVRHDVRDGRDLRAAEREAELAHAWREHVAVEVEPVVLPGPPRGNGPRGCAAGGERGKGGGVRERMGEMIGIARACARVVLKPRAPSPHDDAAATRKTATPCTHLDVERGLRVVREVRVALLEAGRADDQVGLEGIAGLERDERAGTERGDRALALGERAGLLAVDELRVEHLRVAEEVLHDVVGRRVVAPVPALALEDELDELGIMIS